MSSFVLRGFELNCLSIASHGIKYHLYDRKQKTGRSRCEPSKKNTTTFFGFKFFVRSPSAPEAAQYKTKDKHDKQILTRYFVFVLKVCSFSVYIHNAVFCTACLYYIVIIARGKIAAYVFSLPNLTST